MKVTATERIFQEIKSQIEEGELATGERLMSLRKASEHFGVSKNIMVTVYDRLLAHGLVSSRQGAGFHVSDTGQRKSELPNLKAASDIVSLLHTQLDRSYQVLVGDGRPPASWTSKHTMAGAATRQLHDSGYGNRQGLLELRNCIVTAHAQAGIQVDASQVVTTFGANHALDLLIRRFLRAGDTVLADDPGYYPLFAKLKLADVKVVGIPRTPTGPDIQALEAAVQTHRPALFFTQSLVQNPTGCSMSLPSAHAVLQIAERYEMLVVDDDPFIDLPGVNGTRLAQLDQFRRVIQVGTYSKTLSPIYRSGYIIAEQGLASSLAELKMILIVNSSSHTEELIAETILSRRYERIRTALARRLAKEREATLATLNRLKMELFAPPDNGLYGLVYLPEDCDDLEVASRAAEQGIFLAPGTLFSTGDSSLRPCMRVNWSRSNDRRFFTFLQSVS